MPEFTINALTEKITIVDDDEFELDNSETTPRTSRKVKASTIKTYAGGGAAAAYEFINNLLINGGFDYAQRQVPATLTSVADDVYSADRWYILTQTAAIQYARIAGEVSQYAGQMKQNQAAAQRFGIAQIVEAVNSIPLRSKSVIFQGRVKCSASQAIRYAVLEWTGTADTVTSDIVKDWTSATFTADNFFLTSNLTVAAVGTITPTAATWTAFELAADISASCNNLIVLVWVEGTAAQNVTLDVGVLDLFLGEYSRDWLPRPAAQELALCQRYCYEFTAKRVTGFKQVALVMVSQHIMFPVSMRITPTATHNFSAWDGAWAPATTKVGAYNYGSGLAVTNAGAITFPSTAQCPETFIIQINSNATFSGTAGIAVVLGLGPDTFLYWSAEL